MSGEAANITDDDSDQEESSLEWSVSGITAASGLDPMQYTRDVSNTPTPSIPTGHGIDEIDQLISNVQGLRSSLATISEKTVTPTNSPRPVAATEKQTVIQKAPQTPPVKDSGPSDSSRKDISTQDGKLESMRQKLRDLENSSRRSLKFSSERASIDEQYKEMTDFLDRCKSNREGRLEQFTKKNNELEKENEVLKQQLGIYDQAVQKLKSDLSEKDRVLMEIKTCWSSAVETLKKDRQQILNEKAKTDEDYRRIKSEQNEAKNQLYICQNELEKALHLASAFKQQSDQDESIKETLKTQILHEREAKEDEINQLKQNNDTLKKQLDSTLSKLNAIIVEKENYEKSMARERQAFEDEKVKLQGIFNQEQEKLRLQQISAQEEVKFKLKSTEESLHAFYLTQMESIISEKVASLQEYINDWEKKMNEDKSEALKNLQSKHDQQMDSLKKQFSQVEAQIKASEAIHIASRREAETLKGQLEGHVFRFVKISMTLYLNLICLVLLLIAIFSKKDFF